MIKTLDLKYPLGFSDIIPEGIVGILDNSPLPTYKYKHHITKQPVASLTTRKAKTSPKKIDKVKKDRPKVQPAVKLTREVKEKLKSIPDLEINYDKLSVPTHILNLDTTNTIEVDEDLLKSISSITETRAKKLGELLLCNVAPSILAYTASLNYVSAVMQDAFSIEFEEDQSLNEAIRDVTKIEVLEFFVSRLEIPKARKEQLMKAFVDKLTTKTIDRMESILKHGNSDPRLKALEAVLVKKSNPDDIITNTNQERVAKRNMIAVPPRSRKI